MPVNIVPPNDKSFLMRLFFIPYFIQMFKMMTASSYNNIQYPQPRFEVFELLPPFKKDRKDQLFSNLISKYKSSIIIGMFATIIFTFLNLLTPYILKQFFNLMKDLKLEGVQIEEATYITEQFVVLMLLKALAEGFLTRWFFQVSVRVEGTLGAELINKAIKMQNKCRMNIPQSQIFYLQNIDLKLAGKMFTVCWMLFDIPATLLVAVILMFNQNWIYGFVGLFWISVVFIVQRWLGQKIIQCNSKKFKEIEQRSSTNYELFQKIRQVKLDHAQSIIIERNNDFFIKENKDELLFNHYESLFHICLVLLPIIVICTSILYKKHQFNMQQTYFFLSLLGICYKPLKNYQKIEVNLHQGLHSLNRLQVFLNLPENNMKPSEEQQIQQPILQIQQDTLSVLSEQSKPAQLQQKHQEIDENSFLFSREVNLKGGQRLIILSRKGQGSSLFLRTLIGQLTTKNGCVDIKGSIAYLPENDFLTNDTVYNNIKFFNQNIKREQIQTIFQLLGLDKDLQYREGLNEVVEDGKFTDLQMKKIGLARVLCSEKKIYILDNPFLGLNWMVMEQLERYLRHKQEQGVMIILTEKYIRNCQDKDQIVIISKNKIVQAQTYKRIKNNAHSLLSKFKYETPMNRLFNDSYLSIIKEFQQKVRKMILKKYVGYYVKEKQEQNVMLNNVIKNVCKYSFLVKKMKESQLKLVKIQTEADNYQTYLRWFMRQLPTSEWIFAVLLIISIECLHIFIQIEISKEYKKGDKLINSIKTLVTFQLVLTIGLALLIYMQDYVSSCMAIIIGNKMYEKSLTAITNKHINWLSKTDSPILASKYNHDYQQNFSAVKHILTIVKEIVIIITTILLIEASVNIVITITVIIVVCYYSLLKFFRKAEEAIIRTYPSYKGEFVKVYNEITETSLLINVFGRTKQAFQKAKQGFINVSSYKLAVNTVRIVETIVCQIVSTFIIAIALEYGTKLKIEQGEQSEALIAVSVLLLLNLSKVLKKVMFTAIKLQTGVRLGLLAFVSMIDLSVLSSSKEEQKKEPKERTPEKYDIKFTEAHISEQNDSIFEIYPLTLEIKQGQKVIMYEQDNRIKQNLFLLLTKQLENVANGKLITDTLKIGGVNINKISIEGLREMMAVIMPSNFYFTGSLQQNLRWKNKHYNQKKAIQLANKLNIGKELHTYQKSGIRAFIDGDIQQNRHLSWKIALIKAILRKPKIIIIKDIPWTIYDLSIVALLQKEKLKCTVIGITSNLAGCSGADRIIYLQKMKIIQQGSRTMLESDKLSRIGQLLRQSQKRQNEFVGGDQIVAPNKPKQNKFNNRIILKILQKGVRHKPIKFKKS